MSETSQPLVSRAATVVTVLVRCGDRGDGVVHPLQEDLLIKSSRGHVPAPFHWLASILSPTLLQPILAVFGRLLSSFIPLPPHYLDRKSARVTTFYVEETHCQSNFHYKLTER